MTRVVCALSGGGAKTAAHLGALRALYERGLRPSHYVGSSMGAVVAAAAAAGVDYDVQLDRLVRLRRRDVAVLSPRALMGLYGRGLFRPEPLRRTIAALVPVERFQDLGIPLTVTVVDLDSGELVLLGSGGREDVPLHDALLATCALPIYYPPVVIAGRRYVDGGVRAVLPIDVAARFGPDLIFAVDVGPGFDELPAERHAPIPPLVRLHGEVLRVMMAAQTQASLTSWTGRTAPRVIVVRPAVQAETTFALDKAPMYVEEGYRSAVRALADVVNVRDDSA
jgi:NTE family protein